MAKIELKSELVLGTNYKFHVVDFQGTDIVISNTSSTITSTTTDFTASTEVSGVVKRPVAVGDTIKVSNTGSASNEGITLLVTAVITNQIDFTVVTGTPVDEAAGADINITAFNKSFQFLEAGGLSFIDGVAAITWASEVVDQWDTGNYDIYDKMFTSIEPRAKSLAALNGWSPHDSDTLSALRDMALEIRDTPASAARRIYACPRSGNLNETTDQFTFWPATDAELDAPTVAVTTGFINQLILLVDTDNAVDDRGNWTFRCLEPGKTHLQETIDIQYAEIIPVASNNALDPKLADGAGALLVSDGVVSAGGIYANILLNVDVDSLYDGDVDSILYSYTGFIDGDSQSNENVHFKTHYLLRQPVDINSDGTGPNIRGDKAPPITSFLGEVFFSDGYYLLNYATTQRNNLRLVDLSDIARAWPSIFTYVIPENVLASGGTLSLIHEDTFGASAPTYLQDEVGTPQQDIAIPAGDYTVVVAFSTYAVDSHTPNTPIPVRLTWNRPGFIEPDNAKYVLAAANASLPINATADPSYVGT